jgi:hypothetical protein
MYRLGVLLCAVPLFAATVPNRYIVELTLEPVALHARANGQAARSKALLHTPDAEAHRAAIRAQHAAARNEIARSGGTIRGALENLTNALLVEFPAERAAELAGAPGVRAVYPVRQFEMSLDHALPLHHVPDAWTQIGMMNAGANIRVAVIDTGIEISHPGFRDAGFTAPPGFPVADTPANLAFTNNKVIVARSYASLFVSPDPDASAADHVGHGTGTAMAAGGVMNTSPLTTISGVAPEAFLGVYKVFGTPGVNDSASEDAILAAMDDAVNDGMQVINLSLGYNVPAVTSADPFVQAVEAANGLGVLVVVAAGNNGPNPGTVSTPAVAPHALAVAASNNDRMFAGILQIAGGPTITSLPGVGVNSFTPISGPMMDVATFDPSGQACTALPAGALNGAIALIYRGNCPFEIKLDNVQAAGAVAAVVYDNIANEPLVLMGVGQAMLPAVMISNSDGLALKPQIAGAPIATINFYTPMAVNPQSLASFSAAGPALDYSIKPDLTAVGENFYTAAQTLDPNGVLYNPTGYIITQGTSFSAPLAAGAAALLEAGRPGLTVDQYRSLLVNSADTAYATPGSAARVQQTGGGFMNVLSALSATATASPVSISFGANSNGGAASMTITNVGGGADTFQVSAASRESGAPVPRFLTPSAQLGPGMSAVIQAIFDPGGALPGQYEGFIQIQSSSSVVTRVPYWFGIPSGIASYVTILSSTAAGVAGGQVSQAVIFRVTDAAGMPSAESPNAMVVSGGGRVINITPLSAAHPNDYTLNVRLGTQPGSNVFQIQAGSAVSQVTITGQ